MVDSKTLKVRNSTIDFLTFTRQSGEESIEVRVQDNDVWLTQASIAKLFSVDRSVITKHLKTIFEDGEVEENSTCANFAQVADNGKTYNFKFYGLKAVIAESEFEKYRIIQDSLYKSDFDKFLEDGKNVLEK